MADDLEPQADIYDVDAATKKEAKEVQPLYRIFEGSKIPISGQVGPAFKRKFDAAVKAYEQIHIAWNQVFQYYNNDQSRSLQTPRGTFRRGDSTENIVYSNLNIMLPALYSKNPDISCTTTDAADEEFCNSLQSILNALFKRRDKLHAKPKIKKAAGLGLLTNQGVLRLDWVQKDDSREQANVEMQGLALELASAKDQEAVSEIYGKLDALQQQMEIYGPSGPSLKNVMPHNLFVDPYAEDYDGLDGDWMIERVFENTAGLNARYVKKDEDGREVLVYKPTHKAVFADGAEGTREDGLGLVMQTIDKETTVEHHTTEERLAYLHLYHTECYLVWDKAMHRVMLFSRDDWKWPIWVWDDYLHLSRFFPYFLIGYGMSTGGTTTVGEVSYYLDQQDEINDINRQVAKIRRTLFDFFFYNSNAVKQDDAEKFFKAIRGETSGGSNVIGVDAGEQGDISKMIQSFLPPAAQYEPFFNKEPILNSINRLTNTSDALRGVQFKTNTNEEAVNTYQDSARLSVGAKVDVIEDTIADVASSLGELCVQYLTEEDAAGLVGQTVAAGYSQMSLATFQSTISIECVAGSTEKPTSVWKKKEAIQVAQGIGQFAQAAPGASLKIMLKVLEKAFTEVVIQKDDWDTVDQEIQATMQKGISTPGAAGGQQAPAQQQGAPGAGDPAAQMMQAAQALPDEVKAQVMQMAQQGVPNEQILQFIQAQIAQGQQQQAQPTGATNGRPN